MRSQTDLLVKVGPLVYSPKMNAARTAVMTIAIAALSQVLVCRQSHRGADVTYDILNSHERASDAGDSSLALNAR